MLIQGVTSLSLPLYIKNQNLMTRHMINRMWMTIIEWYLDRYADRSKLFLIILYIHVIICRKCIKLYKNTMVFNSTFKNISVISWWSVLLVEETGVP